jgi:hypothetical protein
MTTVVFAAIVVCNRLPGHTKCIKKVAGHKCPRGADGLCVSRLKIHPQANTVLPEKLAPTEARMWLIAKTSQKMGGTSQTAA